MMEVIIMSGLPGSGKSSWAKRNLEEGSYKIVEADQYFVKDGEYKFDSSKIGKAHEFCFSEFYWYLSRNFDYPEIKHLIVANTNTQLYEVSPYVTVCKYHQIPFRIVRLLCSADTCIKRNVHNVPEKTIKNMEKRLSNFSFPKDWNVESYRTDIENEEK